MLVEAILLSTAMITFIIGIVVGRLWAEAKVIRKVEPMVKFINNTDSVMKQLKKNQEYLKSVAVKDTRVFNLIRGNQMIFNDMNELSKELKENYED